MAAVHLAALNGHSHCLVKLLNSKADADARVYTYIDMRIHRDFRIMKEETYYIVVLMEDIFIVLM